MPPNGAPTLELQGSNLRDRVPTDAYRALRRGFGRKRSENVGYEALSARRSAPRDSKRTSMPLNPAIRFSPDAVVMPGMKLMGRQAAGTGFLRAAVANRSDGPLWGFSPNGRDGKIFSQVVRGIDPQAEARWIPAHQALDLFERIGTAYWPAPGLAEPARARLRKGVSAYSLCGVTHTTATHRAMDGVCEMLTAPVMPWDALICTSASVAETVRTWFETESDYLRWRFGSALNLTLPQLPVIPLGVHTEDFNFSPAEKASARQRLDIGEDEVVALFLGRLIFHGKAHPYPMYVGLERAARQTGKRIVLIQCGRAPLPAIEKAFRDGAAEFCPDLRAIFTDGYDPEVRRRSWASADLFISMSDNIQETFGLTPVEAMAAGLPAVITDWNGYKDTVRDGIDGFRIPTFAPPPGQGEDFARLYELNAIDYDLYCAFTSMTVSVDLDMLAARLTSLAADKDLRRKMGEAGRRRARELFDWNGVYKRYQALWSELAEIRRKAAEDHAAQARFKRAPKNAAARSDPYLSFSSYPSSKILPSTLVLIGSQAPSADYRRLIDHPLFRHADRRRLLTAEAVNRVLAAVQTGPLTLQELADRMGVDAAVLLLGAATLAKLGIVRLQDPENLDAVRNR